MCMVRGVFNHFDRLTDYLTDSYVPNRLTELNVVVWGYFRRFCQDWVQGTQWCVYISWRGLV